MGKQTVLVTGGTGFLGSWCIVKLLEAGYRVRTTVRSLKREGDVRAMVKAGGAEPGAFRAVLEHARTGEEHDDGAVTLLTEEAQQPPCNQNLGLHGLHTRMMQDPVSVHCCSSV